MTSCRRIAALSYPGTQLLDIVGPLETFNLAARQLIDDGIENQAVYQLEIFAKHATPEPSMSSLSLNATRTLGDSLHDIDTLLVPGAETGASDFFADADYIAFVKRAQRQVRRVCSVCSGALLLAAAGLLDGKRATTHWMDAPELKRRFPEVLVEDNRIFIEDDGIYTSGGITAGIDLALSLIETDHSRRLALSVAKRLLVYLRRPGDQLQFNSLLSAQVRSTRLAPVIDWISANLAQPISSKACASLAAMSERSFRRHFEAEMGMSLSTYLSKARVLEAQTLLETTELSVSDIARRAGFESASRLRYQFVKHTDLTPSDYRARFGA